MSQNTEILNYLKEHGDITPMQALAHCGCFRLAARIGELRDAGWMIDTEMVESNGKRFGKYVLKSKRKGKPRETIFLSSNPEKCHLIESF